MALPKAEQPHHRRLSEVLRSVLPEPDGSVPVQRIVREMGERSFAALLMAFSAVNLLPLPIGSTLILGIPLVIISWQMVMRRERVWLPAIILDRHLSQGAWSFMIDRIVPRIEQIEKIIRPRYWPVSGDRGERMIGVTLLILGIAVFLPIPLGNWLPAIASFIIALGVSERDGISLGVGLTIGVISLAIIAGVLSGAGFAMDWVIDRMDPPPPPAIPPGAISG